MSPTPDQQRSFNQDMAGRLANAFKSWEAEVKKDRRQKKLKHRLEMRQTGHSVEQPTVNLEAGPTPEIPIEQQMSPEQIALAADADQVSENPGGGPVIASEATGADHPEDTLFIPEALPQMIANRTSEYSPPEWYTKIKALGFDMNQLMKRKDPTTKQALTALSSMKNCIERCENTKNPRELSSFFDELRDHVHKAEFLEVNKFIVRKTRMLDSNGLTRIFATKAAVDYPFDLRADALQLYNRWCAEIFSVDLLRGIVLAKSKNKGDKRNADRIDPKWAKISTKYYGQGDLVIGQWWPTQLCTVRDGAHGSPQAGIYGEKGKGAYSIVLSGGNHYSDEDNGDSIWYCGTDGKDSTPTENTQRMIETCDKVKQPVRVIRSWNLTKSNPYRPLRGFRYDGLYNVVGYQLQNAEKAIYRFKLIRVPGQDPIRYEDNRARRPTRFEIDEYDKLRKLERGMGSDDW